jgi:type VI secretion system secreted protein Hcp
MQGEATAREYENWIEVLGFKHALRLESSIHAGGGGAAAKPDFDPLEITKYLDRTSPTLNHACASGKAIRTVKLDVVTIQGDRPHRLYQIVLDEVWVTAIGMVANPTSGEPRPIETVTLTFSKIRWVYWTPPDGSGGGQEIKEEWDVIAGKGA